MLEELSARAVLADYERSIEQRSFVAAAQRSGGIHVFVPQRPAQLTPRGEHAPFAGRLLQLFGRSLRPTQLRRGL
jgi:hypothetical protein